MTRGDIMRLVSTLSKLKYAGAVYRAGEPFEAFDCDVAELIALGCTPADNGSDSRSNASDNPDDKLSTENKKAQENAKKSHKKAAKE